jgi:hypothetical protein
MSRPRAADDFPMIRSRMTELRRERDRALAEQDGRSPIGPRPYHHRAATVDAEHQSDRDLPCSIFRQFVR